MPEKMIDVDVRMNVVLKDDSSKSKRSYRLAVTEKAEVEKQMQE